ncbi:hypothetical protein [Candidatus Methylobacter oryzae]|uniref:Capsule polysaccharide biosynthesis protein n=1 Tax=Candidatus Methylobacter oryzae TaxID=2497749 RepID=A0ABY3CFM6_9GAMM|nr:hypothetical protein [Candidatus Methylobacter oryzae]TRW97076.1 hypothetical protein EKO24_007985 [Candidatus Methylobacter oryzae]
MFSDLEAPIAVVAYDAGAANHIFAWLQANRHPDIVPCLAGPALALWRQQFDGRPQLELNEALAGVKTLLSGSGWASSIEHEARRLARQLGIKSIAVIDHWTNYRERFIRDGEQILPDEIWVSDAHARTIALTLFPAINIVRQENAYLAGLVSEVERIQRAAVRQNNDRLLYVLEPIRQAWGQTEVPGEFAALDFFVENLPLLQLHNDVQIRLRPHPSDPVGKYEQWLARQRNLPITIDRAPTLAESLAWSTLVVGCQTYAMVIALAAGRKVICSIPPWAPACVLPHPEIIRLSALLSRT